MSLVLDSLFDRRTLTMRYMKQGFAKISDELLNKKNKKLLLCVLATLLVVGAVICIVVVAAGGRSRNSGESHGIIKSACSSTLYPELCFSSITSELSHKDKVVSHKDVIQLALNNAYKYVERNYFVVEKLLRTRKGLNKRLKTALHDCLETIDDTLDAITKAKKDLQDYPSQNKSLYKHADDLNTLISTAITNHETCLDGFSHLKAEKRFRELYLLKSQEHAEHLCSNALAMTNNLTATDIAIHVTNKTERKLVQEEIKWPEWISAVDRRILQSGSVTPNVVVAADGSGNYKTVSAAVAAAPAKSRTRYVIRIKAGVYRENVEVPKTKTNIMFLGDGQSNTIITGSRNVVDGSTTFNSATVAVVGEGFLARGVTFQNSAGPSKEQAVALRVGADLSAFYLCGFIAYQDTLYVHSNRQFFVNCYVAGTVDFIFGNSAVVLQDCNINARRPNPKQKNMVTAQGRVDPNQNTGIVIQKSRISATQDLQAVKDSFPTYLGRPWKEYSRTVIMQSTISDIIHPAGWFPWDGNFALSTLYYGEYRNTGPGADTSQRVNWKGFKVITSASEAQTFTPANFISGSNWLPSTTFPYSLVL